MTAPKTITRMSSLVLHPAECSSLLLSWELMMWLSTHTAGVALRSRDHSRNPHAERGVGGAAVDTAAAASPMGRHASAAPLDAISSDPQGSPPPTAADAPATTVTIVSRPHLRVRPPMSRACALSAHGCTFGGAPFSGDRPFRMERLLLSCVTELPVRRRCPGLEHKPHSKCE